MSSMVKSGQAVADQVIVSGAHFILGLWVARSGNVPALGLFAIGFVALNSLADFHRAALWLPMSQALLPQQYRTARLTSALLGGCAALIGALLAILLQVAGQTEWASLVGALALAVPLLFVHEIQRRIHYALMTPSRALGIDAVYALAAITALVALPSPAGMAGPATHAFHALAIAAAAGATAGAVLLRGLPRASCSVRGLRRLYAPSSKAYVLNAALVAGSQRFFILIIAAVLGVEATGRVEAARLLTAPLMVAATGFASILVPAVPDTLRRAGERAMQALLHRLTSWSAAIAGLYAFLLALTAPTLSHLVFGSRFEGAVPLGVLYCALAATSIIATAYVAPLGVAGDPGAIPKARLPGVLIVLAGSVPAALMFGEVAVLALVVVEGLLTIVILRRNLSAHHGLARR
jgi:O-antigen/teichoic acid export membrane protein